MKHRLSLLPLFVVLTSGSGLFLFNSPTSHAVTSPYVTEHGSQEGHIPLNQAADDTVNGMVPFYVSPDRPHEGLPPSTIARLTDATSPTSPVQNVIPGEDPPHPLVLAWDLGEPGPGMQWRVNRVDIWIDHYDPARMSGDFEFATAPAGIDPAELTSTNFQVVPNSQHETDAHQDGFDDPAPGALPGQLFNYVRYVFPEGTIEDFRYFAFRSRGVGEHNHQPRLVEVDVWAEQVPKPPSITNLYPAHGSAFYPTGHQVRFTVSHADFDFFLNDQPVSGEDLTMSGAPPELDVVYDLPPGPGQTYTARAVVRGNQVETTREWTFSTVEAPYLHFPGGNNRVVVPEDPALIPGADSYSWEFWARVGEAATGWNLPVEMPGGDRYYVGYNVGGPGWNFAVTSFGERIDTAGPFAPEGQGRYVGPNTAGRWVFVQAVLDRQNRQQTLRVYDFANDLWDAVTVTPAPGSTFSAGELQFASQVWTYTGGLREVRFWRSVRSQADVEADMWTILSGSEAGLAAYWPMDEGEGTTVFDRTASNNHGTFFGSPRWETGWEFNFEALTADFALDFGEGPGKDDGSRLLRNSPGDFSLQPDALRLSSTTSAAPGVSALAAVENYVERQSFTLETNVTLNEFESRDGARVGLAVLGGPHAPFEPFNTAEDRGFYGLTLAPATDGTAMLEIREGFAGRLLAATAWEGISPFAPADPGSPGTFFVEDFEDLAAANAAWTSGGSGNIWEIGEPQGGPGSAFSGQYAAGTGLGMFDFYGTNADMWFRSPTIDLSGVTEGATLSFREFLDVDDEEDDQGLFHFVRVRILDPANPDGEPIATLDTYAGHLADWRSRSFPLPAAALNRQIVVEFRLTSDPFPTQFAGWFIDDVTISGFAPMEYHVKAEGKYGLGGALELALTVTDETSFSQSVSTVVEQPKSGDLFGFGGQLPGTWQFDFAGVALELGVEPLPWLASPASFAFGSASGRAGADKLFLNVPDDWSLGGDSLFLAPGTVDPVNSLAVAQIGDFTPGKRFYTRARMTVVDLDSDASENRVGLVLFGDSDPAVFDADNDATFHTFQWIPNPASGPRIVFREGMDGPVIEELALDQPGDPQTAAGGTYTLEFFGTYTQTGALAFTGRLSDDAGGKAALSGQMEIPPAGNHFGFGAYHGTAGSPVWSFDRFDWFPIHPSESPLDFAFGFGAGRDGDEDFVKSGARPAEWLLDESALSRAAQPFRTGLAGPATPTGDEAAAVGYVSDYNAGADFGIRSTVTAGEVDDPLTYLSFNGANDAIEVGNFATHKPGPDSYSWEFWARVDSNVGTASGDWFLPIEFAVGDRYYVGFNAANGWNFMLTSNGNRTDTAPTAGSPGDRWIARITDRWVFVQAVLDRTASRQILRVYDLNADTWHQAEVIPSPGQTVPSGSLWISPDNAFTFMGDLHEMRFWRKARTRAEAEADMHASLEGNEPNLAAYWPMNEGEGETIFDQTANAHHGTVAWGAPLWVTSPSADTFSDFGLGVVALGSGGGPFGTLTDFHDQSFRLEWRPGSGALLVSAAREGAPASKTEIDLSGVSGAPLFEPGGDYTFELGGFFRSGGLHLKGIVSDGGGRSAEITHFISNPGAYLPDNWFGVSARMPESRTRLDWQTFEMGTPAEMGIDPPDFGIDYAQWIEEHFTAAQREDPEISGPLAAPAGDGVVNFLKYALGLDPWAPASGADITSATIDPATGLLRITYAERLEAADIEYVPQGSENLIDWETVPVAEVNRVAHPELAGFDLVTVEADVAPETVKAFLRVLVREL